jgi:hypothetical protein
MSNIYRPFHRPASSCTLPRGLSWEYVEAPADIAARRPDLPKSEHRFGIIKTERPLTVEEQEHFSLEPYQAPQATQLFIEDTGRNGELEIAVMQGDDIKIFPYTIRDLVDAEKLNADFWKRHGYAGRLEITDSDLSTSYVVEVK